MTPGAPGVTERQGVMCRVYQALPEEVEDRGASQGRRGAAWAEGQVLPTGRWRRLPAAPGCASGDSPSAGTQKADMGLRSVKKCGWWPLKV